MNRSVHRSATIASGASLLLILAGLLVSGCGGGNGVDIVVAGDGGEDGSGDATADGPESTDASPDATRDAGTDQNAPRDAAGDAPEDQSVSDAPSDRAMNDAPADSPALDAPGDSPGMDAPADSPGMDATADSSGLDAPADSPAMDAAPDVTTGCGSGPACGAGQVCSNGTCVCDTTSCPTGCCQGNTCEPGNTTSACGSGGGTCASCATGDSCSAGTCVAPNPVCGNGIRETGEQCDDGNPSDLDGCDSTCKFEQITRATQLVIQWSHDTFCTKDVLFEAVQNPFIGNVHTTLQDDLNTDVTNGTDNVVLKYFSISDLTGQSGTATVGSYNATLTSAYTGTFTGNSDLDWWYTLDTTTAGASPLFTPTAKESSGTFTGGVLTATGGHVWLSAFGTSLLDLANVKMQLPIATPATKPATATGTPPAPPGQLAAENIDPALASFATAGGTNGAPTGLLCGDTTAASLAATAVPAQLQSNCKEGYGATSNMLDVFVIGCTANLVGSIINAVQPDQINPDAPAAGAGGPYTFTFAANSNTVTGCKDKNGATVTPYTDCLAPAAYSSYLKMALDRVVLKHP